MAIKPKSTDALALRRFIPIASLSETQFENICSKVAIEEGTKETVLFRQGDKKKEFVYLLSGVIELRAGDVEMETIEAESSSGRFALAHQIPRKVSAIAIGNVRYVRVDTGLLNVSKQNNDEQVCYEVSDIPKEDSDDWMTTLLQSPVFQRLPAANLQKVMMELEEVSLQAGETLFNQGDPGDYYYIIKEGTCALTRKPTKNAKVFKLAELKSCDAFGEDALISDGKRNLTATMTSDGVMLRLHKFKFLKLVKGPVIQYVKYDAAKENLGNRCALVDVRSQEDFGNVRVKGSTNIPFFSLRMHLNGLSRNEQQIIVCHDGNTSEAAAFLLIRFGFDAVVLRDGLSQVPSNDLEGSGDLEIKTSSGSILSKTVTKVPQAKGSSEKKDVDRDKKEAVENTDTPDQIKEKSREMEIRCESLQKNVDLLGSEKETLVRIQDDLKKKIADLQERYSSVSESSNGNKEAMETVSSELEIVRSERDSIRSEYSVQVKEFKQVKDVEQKLKGELAEVRQQNETLEAKLNSVSEDRVSVQNELKEANDSYQTLQEKLSREKDDSTDLSNQLENLEKKVEALTAEKEQWAAEKKVLFQEKKDLQHDLDEQMKVVAQLEKAQQFAVMSEQERILQETEFSQRINEIEGRENQLQTDFNSLRSEKGKLADKLNEKENQTSVQEAELSALREQIAILKQKSDDKNKTQTKDLSHGDVLNDEVVARRNDGVKKDKQRAEEQVKILSAQVDELKLVIQAFLDQDESQDHIEETHSLKSELEMVRVQAETDVKTMQAEVEKFREQSDLLVMELEKEKQQTAEFKVLAQRPTPVNPALTPAEDDVFALLKEASLLSDVSDVSDVDSAVSKKRKLFSWG
ncbi:MAG: cyclic nucleotide-binding domain-containing protein [Methylococcales bacterium]